MIDLGHSPEFVLDWDDLTAAQHLQARGVDVLLPYNGLAAARQFTSAGQFVVGYQYDSRAVLGDHVITSMLFDFGTMSARPVLIINRLLV